MSSEITFYQMYPNLLVVGTHHGINDNDKKALDEIVDSVDFTGIEWDAIRHNPRWRKKFLHTSFSLKPILLDNHLFLNTFDQILYRLIRHNLNKSNAEYAKKTGRTHKRYSPDGNEFLYVKERCAQQNKSCYMVDKPVTHLIKHMLDTYHQGGCSVDKHPNLFDLYDIKGRNNYMLKRLEEKVGTLSKLILKGALFVGEGHRREYEVSSNTEKHKF